MNVQQLHILSLRETDVRGAVRRCGNEPLYVSLLKAFLEDPTIAELNESIDMAQWDEAFTAAHALKGLAGNMGFLPLMQATGQLVVLLRDGRIAELAQAMDRVKICYGDITEAIQQFFSVPDIVKKGVSV